jgi:hypothetical protein
MFEKNWQLATRRYCPTEGRTQDLSICLSGTFVHNSRLRWPTPPWGNWQKLAFPEHYIQHIGYWSHVVSATAPFSPSLKQSFTQQSPTPYQAYRGFMLLGSCVRLCCSRANANNRKFDYPDRVSWPVRRPMPPGYAYLIILALRIITIST